MSLSTKLLTMITYYLQIISRYPHLFAGKVKETNLFFALRVVKEKLGRDHQNFLSREQRRQGKLAMSLKNRQPKEVLDPVVSK